MDIFDTEEFIFKKKRKKTKRMNEQELLLSQVDKSESR